MQLSVTLVALNFTSQSVTTHIYVYFTENARKKPVQHKVICSVVQSLITMHFPNETFTVSVLMDWYNHVSLCYLVKMKR